MEVGSIPSPTVTQVTRRKSVVAVDVERDLVRISAADRNPFLDGDVYAWLLATTD